MLLYFFTSEFQFLLIRCKKLNHETRITYYDIYHFGAGDYGMKTISPVLPNFPFLVEFFTADP